VLLGEASHGTSEFYRARAAISKHLIEEHGFNIVAVEADWPDAAAIDRYVRYRTHREGEEAPFQRFPTWMWRNADVLEFIEWLRGHNDALPSGRAKTGFYGLDLYSLHASLGAVVAYLDKVDPEAAARARVRYACFDHFGEDAQTYAVATGRGFAEPCEDEVVEQLLELQRRAAEYARRDGRVAEDEFFYAEQNARLARNAEEYYRTMFRGRVSSWNLRDRHMVETLEALVEHLDRKGGQTRGGPTKVVVWEHNSHIGDARATEMGDAGELNVGQLVRERWGDQAVLVGFSTYAGTVTAASDWGGPAERKRVRPGLEGSWEALFHEVGRGEGSEAAASAGSDFMLLLGGRNRRELAEALREPRLQRAIGVIYRPETERLSHYFHARLPEQFDAMLHFDETGAVEPLDRTQLWDTGEAPETFPSGL
jgi:erythromycin esterase-like protein